ncbi:MAG: hypothetical protein E5X73_30920, partial [Mesorhizobium sp.]
PPLSCRTSPPQGGRSDVASAFTNRQRWKAWRSKLKRLFWLRGHICSCFVLSAMLIISVWC